VATVGASEVFGFRISPSSKHIAEVGVSGVGSQNHSFAEVLISKPRSRSEVK
jgi:hypothetical protein